MRAIEDMVNQQHQHSSCLQHGRAHCLELVVGRMAEDPHCKLHTQGLEAGAGARPKNTPERTDEVWKDMCEELADDVTLVPCILPISHSETVCTVCGKAFAAATLRQKSGIRRHLQCTSERVLGV